MLYRVLVSSGYVLLDVYYAAPAARRVAVGNAKPTQADLAAEARNIDAVVRALYGVVVRGWL